MNQKHLEKFIVKTIDHYRKVKKIPGIAFGVIKDGKLVKAFGAGEISLGSKNVPNGRSVFRIASMTKSFTAAAIIILRDRHLLRLDDPITKYLPWTKGIGIPEEGPEILIRDLLTMGAGFPTDDPWGDRQEQMSYQDFDELVSKGIGFARNPRTGFEYSNLGYALLGRIITKVSGIDYLDFIQKEIFDELDMKATTFFEKYPRKDVKADGYALYTKGLTLQAVSHPGAFSAMGGMLSTINDLVSWIAHFQSGWKVKAKTMLETSSVREMQEPQRHILTSIVKDSRLRKNKTITTSYGFGLFVDDDSLLGRFVSHSGGYPGFGSHMRWHPQSGYGVVALGNLSYAPMNELAKEVMNFIVIESKELLVNRRLNVWESTIKALDVVIALIYEWDEVLANRHFALNVDMDKPRNERRREFLKLRAKIGKCKIGGIRSDSPATIKAELIGNKGKTFLEVQMSPEKVSKIQKIVFINK